MTITLNRKVAERRIVELAQANDAAAFGRYVESLSDGDLFERLVIMETERDSHQKAQKAQKEFRGNGAHGVTRPTVVTTTTNERGWTNPVAATR